MNRAKCDITASTAPNPAEAKQFWQFKNNASGNEATLYVYGDIVTYDLESWNWPDDVVPNKFKDELNALGDISTIHVRINSSGGSVFAACAIMNLLKSHKAQVITYNDGIAASAATIIAMAGDKIVTALGSVWMIHLPSLSLWGSYNATELAKLTGTLGTITQSMVDIYNGKTGIEKTELENMMKEEIWLTGIEALEMGWADEIAGTEVVAYMSTDKQTAFFNGLGVNIEKIRNKEKLVSLLKGEPNVPIDETASASMKAPRTSANHDTGTGKKEETIMDLNELKEKYPDIYNSAVSEGVARGVQNERNRIKEIDNMALPGMDDLTNKAKYETGVTAGEFAVELIKAQKQKGVQFLDNAKADAEQLNEVPAGSAPQNNNEQEEQALLAKAGERAKNLR